MSAPAGWNAVLGLGSPWITFRRTAVTVTTTSTALPTTALDSRKGCYLYNAGTANVFLGPSDVGTSNEAILFPSQGWFLPVSDAVTIYGRVASGSLTLVVWEYTS